MAKTHLRPQTGGDPAQGPSDDIADSVASPADGNDFPDAPESKSVGTSQDKPDLDAFAKRMGTDTIETGESLDAVPERAAESTGTDSRLIIAGGGAAIAALLVLVSRRREKRTPLTKAVALVAAANVFSD